MSSRGTCNRDWDCRQVGAGAGCRCLRPHTSTFPPYDEGFYKRLIDHLYDAVYFVDAQRRITYWNHAAERLTGYAPAEVVGRLCSDNILAHTDENGAELCLNRCPLSDSMRDGCAHEADVYLRHKKGHRVPVSVRVSPIFNPQGDVAGAVEVFSDNTAKKDAEQKAAQLEQMAFLDCLTRAPNRRFLELRVSQVLEESRRYGHRVGVILVDIDHFKQINDKHGHAAGDAALIVVTHTLIHGLRIADSVGRWGGDEFMAILHEVTDDGLHLLAERCRTLLEQARVPHPDGDLRISVSIGASLIRPSDSLASVLRRIDEMLYESKRRGRNRVTLG